jgi:penicillin amidase
MKLRNLFIAALPAIFLFTSVDATANSGVEVLNLPGLKSAARVTRDTDGIPHIYATTARDAALVQGYVMASDRLFQMDLSRRQVSGTLAEVLGPDVLGGDVEARTIGLRRAAEISLPALSEETQEILEAFAEGVNAYVATNPLPPEYTPLEISEFEPWTAVDCVVIGKGLAFSLSFDIDINPTITYQTYVATGAGVGFDGNALYFEDLFRSAPFDPASTVPDATMASIAPVTTGSALASASVNPPGHDLAKRYLDRVRDVPLFQDALHRSERIKGSNEWAVSGHYTESGRPLIANDPHLALNTPATFYQNHLIAVRDKLNVHGSSVPGVPMIVLGQNQRITWGATTNPADVTDTYLETIVPCVSPSNLCTVYQDNPEAIIPIPVTFRFNIIGDGVDDNLFEVPPGGDIPPAVLIVPRRNNGPIVNLDVDETGAGTALSVQYTGFSATREIDTFRMWNFARDLDEFIDALQYFDVGSQNFVYGDIDGNIGYFTSAEIPIREDLQQMTINGAPPIFIRDGTGGNEWLPVQNPQPGQAVPYEVLPYDEMPHLINPPYFVNANNDPAGVTLDNAPFTNLRDGGGIYYLEYSYAIGTRAGRITDALEEKLAAGPISFEDMQEIQADVVLLDAQVFTPYILEAFENAGGSSAPELANLADDERIAEAVGRLAEWGYNTPTGVEQGYDASDVDGVRLPPSDQEIADSIAATIYSVWRGQILRNTITATLQRVEDLTGVDMPGPSSSDSVKALRNLLDNFEDNDGVGASGLDFFAAAPLADPDDRRDFLLLKSLADALDLLAGPEFADAFGGSDEQMDYRWGRLHRIVFDHPLDGPFSIPPAGGAFPPSFDDLNGLATDGGFGVVDASSHSAYADGSNDFMFGGGPVRRYVGEPGGRPDSIVGETILPGGDSGVLGSPFYTNLLPRWLTNDTYTMRISRGDVSKAAASRTVFVPAK